MDLFTVLVLLEFAALMLALGALCWSPVDHEAARRALRRPGAHELHAHSLIEQEMENEHFWRLQRQYGPVPDLSAGSQWWHGGQLIAMVSFDGREATYTTWDGQPGGQLPLPQCRMLVAA